MTLPGRPIWQSGRRVPESFLASRIFIFYGTGDPGQTERLGRFHGARPQFLELVLGPARWRSVAFWVTRPISGRAFPNANLPQP